MYLGKLENQISEFGTYFIAYVPQHQGLFLRVWGFFMSEFGYLCGVEYLSLRSDMLHLKLHVGSSSMRMAQSCSQQKS